LADLDAVGNQVNLGKAGQKHEDCRGKNRRQQIHILPDQPQGPPDLDEKQRMGTAGLTAGGGFANQQGCNGSDHGHDDAADAGQGVSFAGKLSQCGSGGHAQYDGQVGHALQIGVGP